MVAEPKITLFPTAERSRSGKVLTGELTMLLHKYPWKWGEEIIIEKDIFAL